MAEIPIEQKPRRRGGWTWVLVIVVLAILGAAAWYFLAGPGSGRVAPGEPDVEMEMGPEGGGALPPSPSTGAVAVAAA